MHFIIEQDEDEEDCSRPIFEINRPSSRESGLIKSRCNFIMQPISRPGYEDTEWSRKEDHKASTLAGRYASGTSLKFIKDLCSRNAAPVQVRFPRPVFRPILPLHCSRECSEPRNLSSTSSLHTSHRFARSKQPTAKSRQFSAENAGNISNLHNTFRHMTTGAQQNIDTNSSIPSLMGFTEGLRNMHLLQSETIVRSSHTSLRRAVRLRVTPSAIIASNFKPEDLKREAA